MQRIDFTTTAMPRPDILNRCLDSFGKNLIGIDLKNCDLYINIDPYPYKTQREYSEIVRLQRATIHIAQKYFRSVTHRTPLQPNYTTAYKWVWSQAKTDIIFNLEDDWVLTRPILLKNLLRKFVTHKTLYEVVLRAYQYRYPVCCSSPSLLHRRFFDTVARGMVDYQNPESQLHKDNTRKYNCFIPNKKNGSLKPCDGYKYMIDKYVQVYPKYRRPSQNLIVKDIGREWFESCPYITPIEWYNKKRRKHRMLWKKHHKKGIIYNIRPPQKIKKVDFLSWQIDDEINPLKWLINYDT